MKKTFTYFMMALFIAMLSLPKSLLSAPVVSYIIPDIGSPGMATYIEIISESTGNGNFGMDDLIDKPLTSDKVKIEFKKPEDANKITFAPLIVSWNGRMIATTVFVNPELKMPATSDYRDLPDEYKIQFRINAGGAVSEWQTFYIVKPYQFPDLSDNNTDYTFGEGALGVRSPRGAMIVESLQLNNEKNYSVSTKDCDPNTPGNQGYLPFVLMVKEDIIGKNTGGKITKIDVSAKGKHGGPGGGGGGGRFVDGGILNFPAEGEDGGNGFVSGGPGGQNKSANPALKDSHKNWGQGSGNENGSLNGVPRPVTAGYESAGGGTGHPFGLSGKAAFGNQTNQNNNAGGFGGGSGSDQNLAGGGGGYSTPGSKSNPFNAGRIHGNRVIVPIAGGSGGASGNPQGIGAKSGNGGGGGGAIRIYAKTMKNIYVLANGANGESGSGNSHGGGGSGGSISLFSKILAENIQVQNIGGNTGSSKTDKGGFGRLRLDLLRSDNIIIDADVRKEGEAMYFGFTSDTSNLVARKCLISGTKGKDDKLLFYYKGHSEQNWKISGANNDNALEWIHQLKLFGPDTIYYFVTLNAPAGAFAEAEYIQVPKLDYSSAATNILKIDKFPEIEAEKNIFIVDAQCADNKYKITTKISNKGDAPLEVNFSKAQFAKGDVFEVNQKSDVTIMPKQSIEIVFTLKSNKVGEYKDKFTFTHNDKTAEQYPEWTIALDYELREYDAEFRNDNDKELDTLDFGVICLGKDNKPVEKSITVANTSARAIEISSIKLKEEDNSFAFSIPNKAIEKGSNTNAIVTFNGTEPGAYTQTAYIQLRDCPELKDTIMLKAQLERPAIIIPTELEFGKICKNEVKKFGIRIENPTQLDFDLSAMKLETEMPGISLALADKDFNMKAKSSKDIEVTIDGSKLSKGIHQVAIVFPGASCADIGDVKFAFEIIGDNLLTKYTKDTPLDMGYVLINNNLTGQLTLKLGADDKTPYYKIVSVSTPSAPFSVVSTTPTLPFILTKDNELTVDIKFSPTAEGEYRDSVIVISEANEGMCADTISLHFMARASKEHVIIIDFGKVLSCKTEERSYSLSNGTSGDVIYSGFEFRGEDKDHFSITNYDISKPLVIKPGETEVLNIRYTPSPYSADKLVHTAELLFKNETVNLPSKTLLKGTVEEVKADIILADGADLSEGEVGDERAINVVVTNNSAIPVTAMLKRSNSNISTPLDPIALNAGETKTIPVTCKLEQSGENRYSIELSISEPCEFSQTLYFSINAKTTTSLILKLRVPEFLKQDPRNRDLKIPIYASFDSIPEDIDQLPDINVEFDLTMNATMYYADSISNGTMSSSVKAGERVLKVSVPNVKVSEDEKVICTIYGSALLGDSDSTDLAFSDVSTSPLNTISLFMTTNGKLTYTICKEGGDRLIKYNEPLQMKISPNPASNVLELELTAFEKGKHTVELVNTLGEDIRLMEFDYDPDSPHKVNASIPISHYASGSYLLILRGPNRLITKQLQIIK